MRLTPCKVNTGPYWLSRQLQRILSQVLRIPVCLVAQSCPNLCDPMDCSPPGSSVHGTSQARILDRLPFLPPGVLPNPGTEPTSPALQVDSLLSEPPGKTSPLSSVFLAHDSHGRILKPLFIHSLKISVLPGPTSRSCLMH